MSSSLSFRAWLRPALGTLACLLLLSAVSARAAVIYSGLQNIAVPMNQGGIYVNIVTSATSTTEPGSWGSSGWLNPFWGGTIIASNDVLRPIVLPGTTQNEAVANVAFEGQISSASNFANDYNGSETHMGSGASQFQSGVGGYIGFTFDLGAGARYGWLRMTPNSSGSGTISDWAYEDSGLGVFAGTLFSIPEPSRALLLLLGCAGLLLRRRR